MNTQALIEKLQNGENVDTQEMISVLQKVEKASNSDRVAKYGKGHTTKTYLTPESLHKQLQKQIQAQGYKSQKDFSYHMAETFEALFDSIDKVASLDPGDIVEAVEQWQESQALNSLTPVEESDEYEESGAEESVEE